MRQLANGADYTINGRIKKILVLSAQDELAVGAVLENRP
jgi:hypothetical protein